MNTCYEPVAELQTTLFHGEEADVPAWALPFIIAEGARDVRIDPRQWKQDGSKTVSIITDTIEPGHSNFEAGVIIEQRQSAKVHPDELVTITVMFDHPDDYLKTDFKRPDQRGENAPSPSPFGMTASGLVTVNGLTMRQANGD